MKHSSNNSSKTLQKWRLLLAGTSSLAWCCGVPVMAQTATTDSAEAQESESDDALDEIVVQGLRNSIATAQDIKENADTFVDAISAQDIGALPDPSVSEALQRVPGISILRFVAANDPNRFSIEGSNTLIRGLPSVRSEFNGRDAFGAGGAQIGFQDVSPELLGSVVVFKNQSADLIEGGIGGTISLNTRKPFDQDGRLISLSAQANYGDLRENVTPGFSAVLSDRWETSAGEFGLLLNGSFSSLELRSNSTIFDTFTALNPAPGEGGPEDPGGVFVGDQVPLTNFQRSQDFDRDRYSFGGAAQFESADRKWLATLQYFEARADLLSQDLFTNNLGAGTNNGSFLSLGPDGISFDDDGFFNGGVLTPITGFRGPPPTSAQLPAPGSLTTVVTRGRRTETQTRDIGFNLQFNPNDRLRFNFDAQYVASEAEINDDFFSLGTLTSFSVNVNEDGVIDTDGRTPALVTLAPGGVSDPSFFTDPSNFFLRSILNNFQDNESDSFAFKGDLEYDLSDTGFFRSVRSGVRYNSQDSTIRNTPFLFGFISERFGSVPATEPRLLLASDPSVSALFSIDNRFDNFDRRGDISGGFADGILAFNGPLGDTDAFEDTINSILDITGNPFNLTLLGNRNGLVEGTRFLPGEISTVDRNTFAAYIRTDFGQDFANGVELSGNIGVRYVRTSRDVSQLDNINAGAGNIIQPDQCVFDPTMPDAVIPGFCQIANLDEVAEFFADPVQNRGGIVESSYDYFLPSFNARLTFPGNHNLRFAVSRGLSRPGVAQLDEDRNIFLAPDIPGDTIGTTPGGGDINAFQGFMGNQTGNANLLPELSTNFDLSWEWYFNRTGSITVGGFYKILDNSIITATITDQFEGNNGLVLDFQRSATFNAEDSATLGGIEFAYNQFYDFLPGIFSGFGTRINYTYINANGATPPPSGNVEGPGRPFVIDEAQFPQVSTHNLNAALLYQKFGFQGRLAYNWRSTFQVTRMNVITPFAAVFQPPNGQLDGSIFYDLTDNVKVGLQAVNLLDNVLETGPSVSPLEQRIAPGAFFRNDRRFSFIVRANF